MYRNEQGVERLLFWLMPLIFSEYCSFTWHFIPKQGTHLQHRAEILCKCFQLPDVWHYYVAPPNWAPVNHSSIFSIHFQFVSSGKWDANVESRLPLYFPIKFTTDLRASTFYTYKLNNERQFGYLANEMNILDTSPNISSGLIQQS